MDPAIQCFWFDIKGGKWTERVFENRVLRRI
jgi:hypothetical protein